MERVLGKLGSYSRPSLGVLFIAIALFGLFVFATSLDRPVGTLQRWADLALVLMFLTLGTADLLTGAQAVVRAWLRVIGIILALASAASFMYLIAASP